MPDRYGIRITPRASRDLLEICTYIEKDSPRNASAVAQKLLHAIDSLDILPRRYKVHEHRKNPELTVHSMPVPPFIVYYRVVDRIRYVEVLTVLRGSRKQPRRFR